MSRMNLHAEALNQPYGQRLIRLQSRDPEGRIPARFDFKPRDGTAGQFPAQSRQVSPQPLGDLGLDRQPSFQPGGESALHRSIHGEEGVGDYLQPCDGLGPGRIRSERREPRRLHLRQGRDLAQPAQDESERGMFAASKARPGQLADRREFEKTTLGMSFTGLANGPGALGQKPAHPV